MIVLGCDPGLTTGWALYNGSTRLNMGQVRIDKMPEFLHTFKERVYDPPTIDTVVVEDFMLIGGKAIAQVGSRFETCQVIGMMKLWAYAYNIPVVLQPPTIKPIAVLWSKIKVPTTHAKSHQYDAALHAFYFLVSTNQIEVVKA